MRNFIRLLDAFKGQSMRLTQWWRIFNEIRSPLVRSLRSLFTDDEQMLERVQRAHFQHFVQLQHPVTGLTLDRSSAGSPASIAAIGFALTAYAVAVEHDWIERREAVAYTLKVLRTLWNSPQGEQAEGMSGYHGYFYHFLDPATGLRATASKWWDSELSSIDTALLMAGVLFAKNYFAAASVEEREIRKLADNLYRRVEWSWLLNEQGLLSHGWTPESGMIKHVYRGLSEAHLLYLLALGSPTFGVPESSWQEYIGDAQIETHYGQNFIRCPGSPLFVYQFPHVWVDFRGISDNVNKRLGFDYFENSRRATLAQHQYAMVNPLVWQGYDRYTWGITASDGPGIGWRVIDSQKRFFWAYLERGAPQGNDDGTIAPTAAISSLPFCPALVLPTLRRWLKQRPEIFGKRGFCDAFNPTLAGSTKSGWVDPETVSIDQGAILLMVENYRTDLIRKTMKQDAYLRKGLALAGFTEAD